MSCNVEYFILIPKEIRITPYYILISSGIHSHIPPPPHLILPDELEEIKGILHPMLTPTLTRCKNYITCFELVLNYFSGFP